jgi:hypothetical protein
VNNRMAHLRQFARKLERRWHFLSRSSGSDADSAKAPPDAATCVVDSVRGQPLETS